MDLFECSRQTLMKIRCNDTDNNNNMPHQERNSHTPQNPWLCLVLFVVLILPGAMATTAEPLQKGKDYLYTCQELTPNLCPLTVEQGQLEIKGINVTYWKYYSASTTRSSSSSSLNKLPIVALHGGPSFTHNYMLPLQQQACHGRPIYFYDQAGCGQSRPSNSSSGSDDDDMDIIYHHPWLLDPDYYATVELPALLEHWDLKDGFHIVGSSWGTILAQLYALNATKRQRLVSMVLSGPFSDSQAYIQAQWDPVNGNLGTLPDHVQARIRILEEERAYDSTEYKTLDTLLSGFFTVRTPMTDCYVRSDRQANNAIYVAMQGPSEFTMQGVLAPYNVTGRLHEITVPVLLSHGKYDTMRPSIVQTMQEQLPNAARLYLERSGHCSMIDEPGKMNEEMAKFYQQVEDGMMMQRGTKIQRRTWKLESAALLPFRISAGHQQVDSSLLFLSVVVAAAIGFVLGEFWARRIHRMQYMLV